MRGMAGAKCHSRPPGVASWAARRPPSCVAVLSRLGQWLLWLAASGQGQQGSPSGTAVARAADARHGARARCCWAQRIDEARQRYRFCLDERPTAVADAAVGGGCWVKLACALSARARLCRPLRREQLSTLMLCPREARHDSEQRAGACGLSSSAAGQRQGARRERAKRCLLRTPHG
jgi:hypothetical protein